jgi:hypothetical protein
MPVGAQNLVFFVLSLKPLVLGSIDRLRRPRRREEERQDSQGLGDPDEQLVLDFDQ